MTGSIPDHVHDFYVTNMDGQRVLWVTYRDDTLVMSGWEVHRFTIRGDDAVNMGRTFTGKGLAQCLQYYAEHGMVRVPWDKVGGEIKKWEVVS